MAKLMRLLTNTEIEQAKAKEKEYPFSDCRLYLLVKPNGTKLLRFNYYRPIKKKRSLINFGHHTDVSLQQARKQRDDILSPLAVNVEPLEHRQGRTRRTSLARKYLFR